MKWIKEIRVIYRCKLFFRLRRWLPKYVMLDVESCGRKKRLVVPVGVKFNIVKCKRIYPVRFRDVVFFHFITSRY